VAVVPPLIVAIATAVPPEVGAIDRTAPRAVSATVRYFANVDVDPAPFVAANAVRRSNVCPPVRILLVKVSYPVPAAGMT
jgi:hypothetical protein